MEKSDLGFFQLSPLRFLGVAFRGHQRCVFSFYSCFERVGIVSFSAAFPSVFISDLWLSFVLHLSGFCFASFPFFLYDQTL
ncbi:hypothetical protein U1Q18_011254 [Sarracenia purpurea var. burkii]